jgi:hypothetical protein
MTTEYEINFFTKRGGELVFTLGIEGGSRTKLLYNIITQNWDQGGYFRVDEDDWDDIEWNFLDIICENVPYHHEDSDGYNKFIYNLEMLCKYNLNIRSVLSKSKYNAEIKEKAILETLCDCLVEYFGYEAAGMDRFKYKIVKS